MRARKKNLRTSQIFDVKKLIVKYILNYKKTQFSNKTIVEKVKMLKIDR